MSQAIWHAFRHFVQSHCKTVYRFTDHRTAPNHTLYKVVLVCMRYGAVVRYAYKIKHMNELRITKDVAYLEWQTAAHAYLILRWWWWPNNILKAQPDWLSDLSACAPSQAASANDMGTRETQRSNACHFIVLTWLASLPRFVIARTVARVLVWRNLDCTYEHQYWPTINCSVSTTCTRSYQPNKWKQQQHYFV